MSRLWINNEIVDRLAMLQQVEVAHSGINQDKDGCTNSYIP